MTRYRFLTTWLFAAPIERDWERLDGAARRPEWWRGVERTEILGSYHRRSAWKSSLP